MMHSDRIRHFVQLWHLQDFLNPDLLRSLRLLRLAAGRDLAVRDDEDANLYFLVEGQVRVTYDHLNGKPSVVGTMAPLALIGELDLFYRPNLQLTIVTQEPCSLLYINKLLALRYGRDDPRFLRLIIHNLSKKLTDSTLILKHNVLPLIGQVAAYLADRADEANPHVPTHSKNHLAELMGTTTRHLNRVLNTMADERIISVTSGGITVIDFAALRRLANS